MPFSTPTTLCVQPMSAQSTGLKAGARKLLYLPTRTQAIGLPLVQFLTKYTDQHTMCVSSSWKAGARKDGR